MEQEASNPLFDTLSDWNHVLQAKETHDELIRITKPKPPRGPRP